jgi:hypothetical protein
MITQCFWKAVKFGILFGNPDNIMVKYRPFVLPSGREITGKEKDIAGGRLDTYNNYNRQYFHQCLLHQQGKRVSLAKTAGKGSYLTVILSWLLGPALFVRI